MTSSVYSRWSRSRMAASMRTLVRYRPGETPSAAVKARTRWLLETPRRSLSSSTP